MSVTFSLKGVPDDVAALLRERAERHRRSLQGELLAIIEAAARGAPVDAAAQPTHGQVVGYDNRGHPIVRNGPLRIEVVAAELRARTPKPREGLPLAVDIIREARDNR